MLFGTSPRRNSLKKRERVISSSKPLSIEREHFAVVHHADPAVIVTLILVVPLLAWFVARGVQWANADSHQYIEWPKPEPEETDPEPQFEFTPPTGSEFAQFASEASSLDHM